MDWTSFIGIAGLVILMYIIVYSIVDRICRCKEHCATAHFVSQIFMSHGNNVNITELEDFVNKIKSNIKNRR